jgi:twinkle protein
MDALSWIENGYNNVLSVPNGANNNLEYLDNTIDLFNDIEKIYLATDNDFAGIKLRDELIRRFGPDRCSLINFKQYKDSNDYFVGCGGIEFKNLIKDCIPVPVKGIVNIESIYSDIVELYENGTTQGQGIQFHEIDESITWELGRLAIVTGVPGSGKSEFVDYIISRLNLLYGYKVALFTPENYPLKFHYRKIHEKYSGQKFESKTDRTDFLSIYEYISDNYFYILNEEDMTVESVMKSALSLVKSKGIKILVIDPYNKLEHQYTSKTSETQYISKFLDILTNFARFNNVLIILVAHPTKMQRGEVPTLYHISGSANFYNKCDYGMTVHRELNEDNLMSNLVELHVQKVKFKNLGKQAVIKLKYNYINGRFERRDDDINSWDYSNWLESGLKQMPEIFEFTENEIPF